MDATDFGGLAARAVAGLEQVRACLILSRDGLTLGAHPEEAEEEGRGVWDLLESIGEPERGFLVVEGEVWVVARRGPYAGIVVASASAKPGLLLDRLEAALRAAEEARTQASPAPARPDAPRRPRTPLHREPENKPVSDAVLEELAKAPIVPPARTGGGEGDRPPGPSSVTIPEPEAPQAEPPRFARPAPPPASEAPRYEPSEPLLEGLGPDASELTSTDPGAPKPADGEAPPVQSSPQGGAKVDSEVDPVVLAREFARLFDEGDEDD